VIRCALRVVKGLIPAPVQGVLCGPQLAMPFPALKDPVTMFAPRKFRDTDASLWANLGTNRLLADFGEAEN
jgi:hypothetical protein